VPETVRPLLAITAPLAGQRVSNELFQAKGTASDNYRVDQVMYQLNNGLFTSAVGTKQWSANLDLTPGTNVLRALAIDGSGNYSLTSSVSFFYVVPTNLTVVKIGQGVLTPNYTNGQRLEIGRGYAMTATPTNGHVFSNWVVSVNGVPGAPSVSPTVRFMMAPGLGVQATFVDVTKPACAIVSPVALQRISNTVPVVTVKGATSDNVGVTAVNCQLNGGPWVLAGTANAFKAWTNDVTPIGGTNVVRAFALDAQGNHSLTSSVSFFYVVPVQITLATNGIGTITRSFAGNMLEIGRPYTVTAVPGAGQVFSNWVGTVTSSSAALTFLMQTNMSLTANFIPNPFIAVKGTYNGLFTDPNRGQDSSGYATLATTASGAYSGYLLRAGQTNAFTGQFAVDGTASKLVPRAGTNALALSLTLGLTPGTNLITGTVSDSHWVAPLTAYRSVFNTTNNRAPYMGKYTLTVPGSTNDDGTFPFGLGYGAVTVDAAGNVVLSGSLADGTPVSQSTTVSQNGWWPLYSWLYGGKGSVFSWVSFVTNAPPSGQFSWIKPALPVASTKFYPQGFTNLVMAEVAHYVAPTNATTRVIDLTNGVLSFEGGNLLAPFSNNVVLTANNLVTNAPSSTNKLTFSLTVASGVFSGTVAVPGTRTTNTFKGTMNQEEEEGYGYFLGTNRSGRVLLRPSP
jgi:hypothetical protein